MRVCVLGAGIIGATSAYNVITKYPQWKMDIIAEKFSPDTTSDGVAGYWEPHLNGDTPKEKAIKWSAKTYEFCEKLWCQSHSDKDLNDLSNALSQVPSIEFWDLNEKINGLPAHYATIPHDYRTLDSSHAKLIDKTKNMSGHGFLSYVFEPRFALPIFYEKLKKKGVQFIKKKVENFNDLANDYDIIINCCGAGAYQLLNDGDIQPISGHVLRAKAPFLHNAMADYLDGGYLLPTRDSVILGAVNRSNSWSTTPVEGDKQKILEKCTKICPMIKDQEIIKEWIGLRPFRVSGVRLEKEIIGSTLVIHNYGHGGSGITFSWGCAQEVLEILSDSLLKSHL